MKILLIQPKMNKRPMDTDLKTQMSPPLGLFTLVNLTPAEHDVLVVNENAEKIPFEYPADIVGITVTVDVFPRACEIAEKFKSYNIPVVAGGIHISCNPDNCISHFDAICIGPAERVWTKILDDVKDNKLKKTYQDTDNFNGNEIVSPAYNKIDKKKYLYSNVVITGKGCPCHCNFCYNSCDNRIYAKRPVQDVINDIKTINNRHIYFVDDNFIGDIDYTFELLSQIKKLNLKWNAAVTTNILKHLDLLDFMVETGCQSLFIGFESLNNAALENVQKDNKFELYDNLVNELHKRGIMINASMVFGLDGDGSEVFNNTLKWLVKNKIETLTAHILTPYPGTNLYKRMESENRIVDYNLAHYNTAYVVYKPTDIKKDELIRGYLKIYRQFYSFKNIIRRKPINPKQRKSYFLFNFLYRKFGKFTSVLCKIIPMSFIGRIAERFSYKI